MNHNGKSVKPTKNSRRRLAKSKEVKNLNGVKTKKPMNHKPTKTSRGRKPKTNKEHPKETNQPIKEEAIV